MKNNNNDNWDTGVRDFISADVAPRIKKPKRHILRYLLIGLFILILAGLYLGGISVEVSPSSQTALQAELQATREIIQINGRDAIMWTYPDGSQSARVQYEKCGDVATINGWVEHCDREIINVKWE